MSNSPAYNWSDAWLLLAIIYAGREGPANLERIIASGDALNFAILKADELESGLMRLTWGGYIEEKDGAIYPTTKALSCSKSPSEGGRATHDELKDVGEMLDAAPATEDQPARNNLTYPGFSASAYEQAVERYLHGT